MIGSRRIPVCLQTIAVLSTVGLAGCGSPEQRAQDYYEHGMALIAKNDDLNARLELLNAVKSRPTRLKPGGRLRESMSARKRSRCFWTCAGSWSSIPMILMPE